MNGGGILQQNLWITCCLLGVSNEFGTFAQRCQILLYFVFTFLQKTFFKKKFTLLFAQKYFKRAHIGPTFSNKKKVLFKILTDQIQKQFSNFKNIFDFSKVKPNEPYVWYSSRFHLCHISSKLNFTPLSRTFLCDNCNCTVSIKQEMNIKSLNYHSQNNYVDNHYFNQ